MSRSSGDRIVGGRVIDGFDYDVQAWVKDGIYQDCGHPDTMKAKGCCNAHKVAGLQSKASQSMYIRYMGSINQTKGDK